MTATKVIDASAIAAILFDEEESDVVVTTITGFHLAAPTLLDFELANVCLVTLRRAPDHAEAIRKALRLREKFNIQRIAVEHGECVVLATRTKLTAYDASYLWSAQHLGVELVTLDKQISRAASAPHSGVR